MSRLIDADAYSAEMKKRQDACEKLMHDAERWNDVTLMGRANSAFSVFAEAKLTLDKMPTVDAVQVVHCKDCKWFKEFTDNCNPTGRGSCENDKLDMFHSPRDDWFCADGVKKDG